MSVLRTLTPFLERHICHAGWAVRLPGVWNPLRHLRTTAIAPVVPPRALHTTTTHGSSSQSRGGEGWKSFRFAFHMGAGLAFLGATTATVSAATDNKKRKPSNPPRIIISGAPGSGKGTQCEFIVQKYGVVHISTGDLLRDEVKRGTPLGKKAHEFMSKGELVPDDVVIGMVKNKLDEPEVRECGWLLDGFPRTAAQAMALEKEGIHADAFLLLDVPDSVLVERITGRRSDPVTGKIYHMKFNPPPNDPEVLARLIHRKDDTEEALRTRLVTYHKNVEGIVGFYEPILRHVRGQQSEDYKTNVATIRRQIGSMIDNLRNGPPHVIISGAPGSGKGTQCEFIVQKYGVVHISTGDLLRDEVKRGTPLGKKAHEFMSKGELVPDDVVIGMVKNKLDEPEVRECGWLLDGFPRTAAQAMALEKEGIHADAFLLLDVPDSVLVERITGRRSDPVTGKIYHMKFNPPPNDPEVLARLIHRKDDTEEALRTRLVTYHKNVEGIVGSYEPILRDINGQQSEDYKTNVATIRAEIEAAIMSCKYGPPQLVISGAPGSGKGTQCEFIVQKYGVVHISTGDLLRDEVKRGTPLGKKAHEFMSKGELVPDDVVIGMVKNKLEEKAVAEKGVLLDGFPRTAEQARALDEIGFKADTFLLLDVPDSVLVERITGRRSDPVTGKIYHMKFNPPPNDPEVLARLIHRKDDTEEALRTRLVTYHKNVKGILGFYKPILHNVNGERVSDYKTNVSLIQEDILASIDQGRHGGHS